MCRPAMPPRCRPMLPSNARAPRRRSRPRSARIAVETAIRALRSGGRAVVLGIGTRPVTVPPLDLVVGEKSVIGSLSHVWDEDFRIALGLLGRGAVQAAPLISDRIPLSAAVSGGLALLRDEPGKHVKILVQPEGRR